MPQQSLDINTNSAQIAASCGVIGLRWLACNRQSSGAKLYLAPTSYKQRLQNKSKKYKTPGPNPCVHHSELPIWRWPGLSSWGCYQFVRTPRGEPKSTVIWQGWRSTSVPDWSWIRRYKMFYYHNVSKNLHWCHFSVLCSSQFSEHHLLVGGVHCFMFHLKNVDHLGFGFGTGWSITLYKHIRNCYGRFGHLSTKQVCDGRGG